MKRIFKVPIYLGIMLIVTALAGCADPLETPRDAPARGTGHIVVSIGGGAEGARTVAPDTGVFTKYSLAFSGPSAFGPVDIEHSGGTSFDLQPGTWTIVVTGYAGTEAVAEGSAQIILSAGETVTATFVLGPKTMAVGMGTFRYAIAVPAGATGSLVITTAEGGAVDGGTIALEAGTVNAGEKALAPGEYLARARLEQDGEYAGFTEALHVYAGLVSALRRTYTHGDFSEYLATTPADSGPGSLRQALADAQPGQTIQVALEPGSVIALRRPLTITKNITIEGNGVTLTRAPSWTAVSEASQLVYIPLENDDVKATIRRVRFKDGRAANYGGAIRNHGTLTLESCIFTGNRTTGTAARGGAIYSNNTLTIRGCTFYDNTADAQFSQGGAVYLYAYGKTLTLTGNLFYGNSAAQRNSVLENPVWSSSYAPNTVSASYNVVDGNFGTGGLDVGWNRGTGDAVISSLPVSPVSFRPLYGSGAAARLPSSLPAAYPLADFYGNPISGGGAAGAVQGSAAPGRYYLETSVNNSQGGSVTVSPAPDEDGLVPAGSVSITANANDGYSLGLWLVNGARTAAVPTRLSAHAFVQALFNRVVTVTNFADGSGIGTLRRALAYAQEGDTIRFEGATPGITSVELKSALPAITKSLTIEGNGVILTRAASWTGSSETSQLLRITGSIAGGSAADAEVVIRRVHFKDGLAANYGGAIENRGILTLESCIFSGNRTTGGSSCYGGALFSDNALIIRGCIFYGNSSDYYGGAVYSAGTLTLTGNLFYGNTAKTYYPVLWATSTGASYNVVDAPFGTGKDQCGWTARTGDFTFTDLSISGDPFDTTTFAPVAALSGVLPSISPEGFPAADFYGAARTFPGAPGAVKYNEERTMKKEAPM